MEEWLDRAVAVRSGEELSLEVLEPFLLPRAGRTVAEVTTTTPVLGEEE